MSTYLRVSFSFSLNNFIEITKEQDTCQRAEFRQREAFKLARAQPENRREQEEKGSGGGTLKRNKQRMGIYPLKIRINHSSGLQKMRRNNYENETDKKDS